MPPSSHKRRFAEGRLDPETLARPGAVLLESQRPGPHSRTSYLLTHPAEVIACQRPEDVAPCLRAAGRLLESGLTLAGFISYEAAAALDPALPCGPPGGFPDGFPLVWLAAYERPVLCRRPLTAPLPAPKAPEPRNLCLDMSKEAYMAAVGRARAYIAAGDNYQTNLTCRLSFESEESPLSAYLRLRVAQPVPFGAYLDCGPFQVVSASPELFLRRRGGVLESRPMKGTQRRGRWSEEDEGLARSLRRDTKSRAENVMIVDLMRHDLGRLAEFGTVAVSNLFRVERYATLLQMTSTVRCRLREGLGLIDILRAAFPPGSVTGAPKRRTMQIIQELEPSPRRLYTGAIGIFHPGGDFTLSVAIRTLVASGGRWELGVGSGIVADSDPAAEYEETWLKSRFAFAEAEPFQLLETMRGVGGQLERLEGHLARMRRSARYFGLPWSRGRALAALAAPEGAHEGPQRVRLLLDQAGRFEAQWQPLAPPPPEADVLLSGEMIDSGAPWPYHKTTRRAHLERELARARGLGFTEVLFVNERGELTEGAFTSLMVRLGGRWLTPALPCGLLPGLWRAEFMRRHGAREARLSPADLSRASRVLIGNSVRNAIPVRRVVDHQGRVLFGPRKRECAVAGQAPLG